MLAVLQAITGRPARGLCPAAAEPARRKLPGMPHHPAADPGMVFRSAPRGSHRARLHGGCVRCAGNGGAPGPPADGCRSATPGGRLIPAWRRWFGLQFQGFPLPGNGYGGGEVVPRGFSLAPWQATTPPVPWIEATVLGPPAHPQAEGAVPRGCSAGEVGQRSYDRARAWAAAGGRHPGTGRVGLERRLQGRPRPVAARSTNWGQW